MSTPIPFKVAAAGPIAELLNRVLKLEGFFPEFKVEHISRIFPRSGLYYYAADAKIIKQGDAGRDIFIIYEGKVSIIKTLGDAGADVAHLGSGDMFGEIALVRDGLRVASAIAEVDCKIFLIRYQDLEYLLKHHPELANHLKKVAEERLAQ